MSASPDETKLKAAVIGMPIGQSLSPLMHNYWFGASGLAGEYAAVEVAPKDLEQQLDFFRANHFSGFNITVPHKTAIVPFLDKLSPSARQIGAVNTVKIAANGALTGFNTDGVGFLKNLKEQAPGWPKDKPSLVLGAGGAARAAIVALLNDGVPMVMLCNRTRAKAQALADEIGRGQLTVVDWADRAHAVAGAGLIVNTTVLGMAGQEKLALDLSGAASGTVIYDIVYKPLNTDLLKTAKNQGLRTVDGLGMLVHQGAAAFKIWFDRNAEFDDALRAKLLAALDDGLTAEGQP